jgi:hypothetical protein
VKRYRYFTQENLAGLREKLQTIGPKTDDLLLKYVAHRFANPTAKEYAHHGFARRIQTLSRCIYNVFKIVPPGTVKIPSKERLHDAQINIQAAIGNSSGCVDNLAWVWVHEHGLAQSIDRTQVGLRKHNKKVRDTLSAELRAYLDSLEGWFGYLIDYRDALAHRIPVYIPPGGVRPKDHDKAKELEERKTTALNALLPYEYERLEAAQMKLLVFQPLVCHSFTEMPAPFAFHPQLICDFLTVEQLGERMLTELSSVVGRRALRRSATSRPPLCAAYTFIARAAPERTRRPLCAGTFKPPNPLTTPRPVAGPSALSHPASRADSRICEANVSPIPASGREPPPGASSPPRHCS